MELTKHLPGTDFHGATIPLYDLDLGSRRIAPSWLAGEAYQSAFGHHSVATHCPASGDILIDRCPRCEATLRWSRIQLDECHRCGLDMREHVPSRVTGRQLRETRPMLDIVHPDPARHGPAVGHFGWRRLPAEAALAAEPSSFAEPAVRRARPGRSRASQAARVQGPTA